MKEGEICDTKLQDQNFKAEIIPDIYKNILQRILKMFKTTNQKKVWFNSKKVGDIKIVYTLKACKRWIYRIAGNNIYLL